MSSRALSTLVAAVAAVAALELAACRTTPSPVTPAAADPAGCAECHQAIASEWSASAHAVAWTSPAFREATEDYTAAECLGCHAPASLYTSEGAPSVRRARRAHGVDCQSCHLWEGALAGPIQQTELPLAPHPVRRVSFLYHSAELCGRCHQETYAEYRAATRDSLGVPATCQECHMPAVSRVVSEGSDVGSALRRLAQGEVPQRRHTFDLEFAQGLDEAVEVANWRLARRAGEAAVSFDIVNHLPHAVPSGAFNRDAVRLVVRSLSERGDEVDRAERRFGRESAERLLPSTPLRVDLTLADAPRFEVLIEHLDPRGGVRFRLYRSVYTTNG